MQPILDPATLRAEFAQVEHQLAEMDRRSGNCALCRSADLKAHLGELRLMLEGAEGSRRRPA
jgi:hypothetical protein